MSISCSTLPSTVHISRHGSSLGRGCSPSPYVVNQVGSEEVVEKAGEIVVMDGAVGSTMGYLWDPHDKKVQETLQKAEAAVLKGGKFLFGFAMPHNGPDELRWRGYHMVSGTTDVGLFRAAVVEDMKRSKLGGDLIDPETAQINIAKQISLGRVLEYIKY